MLPRRLSTKLPRPAFCPPHSSSDNRLVRPANPTQRKPRTSEPPGPRPARLKPRSLDNLDHPDPARVADVSYSDPLPADTRSTVATSLETPPTPFPTSPQSLYRNLLFITSNPPFSIAKTIDYYFDWPKALHSTKSFNLLISLALRSASFATVRRLFSAMRAESIPPNMETSKLHIRWFVRTGRWDDAWERVLEITGKRNVATPKNPVPLTLWLELFGSQKHGALRHWVITDEKPNMQTRSEGLTCAVGGGSHNVLLDTGSQDMEFCANAVLEDDKPRPRKRLVPRPSQTPYAVELSRYRALMQVSPLPTSDQAQILPRTVLIITRIMYQVGQRSLALSTALSYLESLPPRLGRCDRRRVLHLVNFHLSMVARHQKRGLKQHFSQRRILWKFLHTRPDLVPSSVTLFFLLGSLRACRHSGTLAMQCLRLFEKKWGPRVQSRLVRRRIASLALKEGRLDVVESMIRLEKRHRAFEDTMRRTVYASRRKPFRTLFSRRGAERWRWRLIEEKHQQRSMQKSGS